MVASAATRVVEVAVTASTGRSVVIDQGSSAGLDNGMRVRFYPPGANEIEGYIQNISVDSARVELAPNTPLPPAGSRGEVEIEETPAGESGEGDSKAVEHPPWSRELQVAGPDDVLLSPAFGLKEKDRPPSVYGRLYTQFNYTRDRGDGRDSDYYLGRVGVWGTAKNLFHDGGRLQFAGEGNTRGFSTADGADDSEFRGRLDRLSYALGGQEYSPYRAEIGRFYSEYLPELGLVDGVEGALRFRNGITAGVGGGSYPLPNNELNTGEDLGVHGFIGYRSDKDHAFSTILAYQKTWHSGDADRDLIFARMNVRPTQSLRLYGSIKADIHTSEDTVEDSSFEISQAWFQAQFVPDNKKGLTLSYSHYSWPELKREEFQGLPDSLVSDGYVERGSLSGWVRIRDHFRISARGNVWLDQDNTGGGGEAGFDWTDIKDHGTSLYSSVSYTQGTFNNGIGGRVEVRQRVKTLDAFAGYQVFQYQQDDLIAGNGDSLRHTARAGLGWNHGSWYHSLNSDYYFGDGENAVGLTFYTEWRF